MNNLEIFLYDVLHLHQGKNGSVLMMSQKLALLSQTHGVDAVGLEGDDGKVGTDRDHHQRQEEVVSTSQLRNQKDAC